MGVWIGRLIALFDLAGGVLGLWAVGQRLADASGGAAWIIDIVFLAYFAFGLWAGLALLKPWRGALSSNRLYWVFQLLSFSTPWLGYRLVSGGGIDVAFLFGHRFAANVNGSAGSDAVLRLAHEPHHWVVAINVVAVAVFAYVIRPRKG